MQLRHVLVLTRDVEASLRFWGPGGLGLAVALRSDVLAELALPGAGSATLALKQAQTEAQLCHGYSPQLVLELGPGQLDDVVPRLCGLGAMLDGPIKFPAYGKLASMRSPDGVLLGLFERAT